MKLLIKIKNWFNDFLESQANSTAGIYGDVNLPDLEFNMMNRKKLLTFNLLGK